MPVDRAAGGHVAGCAFLIELPTCAARDQGIEVFSLLSTKAAHGSGCATALTFDDLVDLQRPGANVRAFGRGRPHASPGD